MTSFLISFPDIPAVSDVIGQTSGAANDFTGVSNLVRGRRENYFISQTAHTGYLITWDVGSGNTMKADHVIVARADKIQTGGMDRVRLQHSSDDVTYASAHDDASFDTANLVGPRFEDYIGTFTETALLRYWRYRHDGTPTITHVLSKVYFGLFFDFGVEPDDYEIKWIPKSQTTSFKAGSGTEFFHRPNEPVYQFTGIWRGVTNALLTSFAEKAATAERDGCFLYTATQTELLDDHTLLHCRLVDWSSEMIFNDWHLVRATFEELIG